MRFYWKNGIGALVIAFAPACMFAQDSSTQASEAGAGMAPAHPEVGEALALEQKNEDAPVLDVTIRHKCGLVGHSKDDKYRNPSASGVLIPD